MGKLNKDSSVALYQQLVNEIKEQIQSGELKAGDRLMTEVELSREYDISRITVRKAIEILVDEEILIKKQGIGTFVAEKKLTRDAGIFMGFTRSCILDGKTPGTRLLSADLTPVNASDRKNLGLGEEEKVIRIRRLRFCDGVPVVLEENHFSQKYAFLLGEDLEGSLYEILEKHGIYASAGRRKLSICYANREESELLQVSENDALLMMKDTCTTSSGEAVHTCKSIINPQLYELVIISHSDCIGWEKV
ncbi:MAG: GntR family transcriptional regulator [Candidatus Limivivens sp.]|nr:GntR family transcriptional regulator [Candidatus Limivivens sp.]